MTEVEAHWRRCFPDLYALKLKFERERQIEHAKRTLRLAAGVHK